MKRALAVVIAAATGLLGASAAFAQPGAYGPPGAAPPPPPAGPAGPGPAPALPSWSIGLRLVSMEITSDANQDDKTQLGGAGVQLSYRLAPAWRAQVSLENAKNADDAGLGYTRSSDMATLALHYIFNPYSAWNWYGLGGFGQTSTEILYGPDGAQGIEKFKEGHFRVGLGLERRFDRLSLGAELCAMWLHRDDSAGDGPIYAGVDGPVPAKSSAGHFNLHLTYSF